MAQSLTQTRLKDILQYSPETGWFTWLKPTSFRVKVGSIAGRKVSSGFTYIGVDGEKWLSSRLAWLYMTGNTPTAHVGHKDNNSSNDSWENLQLIVKKPSEELTQGRLKELVEYDPAIGDLRWKVEKGPNAKAGGLISYVNPCGYTEVCIDGRSYRGHRLAWLYMTGQFPAGIIDHKDGCKLNNSWENLRQATHSQNHANVRSSRCKSGFKGVSISRDKFVAEIRLNKRTIYIGSFTAPEDAHNAYKLKHVELFKEFSPYFEELNSIGGV